MKKEVEREGEKAIREMRDLGGNLTKKKEKNVPASRQDRNWSRLVGEKERRKERKGGSFKKKRKKNC